MKKFIILTLCFLLCGCTASYEINITNGRVEEKLNVVESNSDLFDKQTDSGWTLREIFKSAATPDQYSKSDYDYKYNDDNKLSLEVSGKSYLENMNSLQVIDQCYNNASVTTINNVLTISTGNEFVCSDYYGVVDKIIIKLTTNHKVYDNNANKVNGNTYIWEFTKDSDYSINISIDKEKINSPIRINLIIIIVATIVVVSFIGLLLYKKNKKENSF